MFKDTNNPIRLAPNTPRTSPPTGAVIEIFRKKFSAVVATPSACNLNIRTIDDISSPVITTVKPGDIVDVESCTEAGWSKVRTTTDIIGYCQTKYLTRRST